MIHNRIIRFAFAAAFLTLGLIWQIAIPLAQTLSTPAIGVITTGSTIVDIAPLVQMGIAAAWLLLMIVGAWFIFRYTKTQEARSALLNVLAAAAAFGVNATKGALKDKPMTVDVASNVLATGLRYAMARAPDALDHFGFDPKTTARALLARLPGVDGEITDDTLNRIVGAATGAPTGPIDIRSITEGVMAEIAARGATKPVGAPGAPVVAPAAPAPAPVASSASPPATKPVV